MSSSHDHGDSPGSGTDTSSGDLSLERLAEEVGNLHDLINERSRSDEVQRRAFDQLYEELRQYKENFIYEMEKPLLLDLLLFHDSLIWFQQSLIKQEMSADVIADNFQYLIDEFMELLYRRDVLPVESKPVFDRRSQKAIKMEPTDDPKSDYRVKQVLKRGFTRGGRLLRPEEVVVCRYRGGDENSNSSE